MTVLNGSAVSKLVVACDAAMGSSLLLASSLRRDLEGTRVTVQHAAVNLIPADADLVICHQELAERTRASVPGKPVVVFRAFSADPAIAMVVDAIKAGTDIRT